MPTWLAICVAVYPPLTGIGGLLWVIYKRLSTIGQHFDPDSEVSRLAGGTLPDRVKVAETKIAEGVA